MLKISASSFIGILIFNDRSSPNASLRISQNFMYLTSFRKKKEGYGVLQATVINVLSKYFASPYTLLLSFGIVKFHQLVQLFSGLVDRNVQVSYVIVDQMHRKSPKLSRDMFWDNLEPEMPYTQAAASYRKDPFFGSTTAMKLVF